VLLLAGGCVTVQIDTAGADPVVVRHLGWLQVQVNQPEQAVVGRLQGLGLVSTPMGVSLGFTRERWAALGPGCRAVLWAEDDVAINETMRRTLAEAAGACLADGATAPPATRGASRRQE